MPTAYSGPPHCSTCGAPKSVCTWTEDDDGVWTAACGNAWVLTEGGPTENDMRFCCLCGGLLIEQPYVWETDDDQDHEGERERAINGAIEQEIEEGNNEQTI